MLEPGGTDLSNKSISDCGDFVQAIGLSSIRGGLQAWPVRQVEEEGELADERHRTAYLCALRLDGVLKRYVHPDDQEHRVEGGFQCSLAVGDAFADCRSALTAGHGETR